MTARSLWALSIGATLMLVSSAAGAVSYGFTGKFTSNRGKIINIPVVGNTPCAPLTLMSGPGMGGKTTPMTHMIVRGANTQPQKAVTTNFNMTGRDLLCVAHLPGKKLTTDNMVTAMGNGGGFVMPPNVFSKPLPPYVRAVEVKYAPPVLQLATSFKITGPGAVRTTPPAGTMVNGANTAPFHAFEQNAFAKQSGRGVADFAWCPNNPPAKGVFPCGNITQGGPPLLIRYSGPANGRYFGGTMAYIITTGPNVSSLGIGAGGAAAGFQVLAGMGSQPTGRGFAEFLTDKLMMGPIYAGAVLNTVTPGPILGMQKLITMVGAKQLISFPSGTNFNWGFPFTTRTVLVRNYASRTTTLTAMGYDKRGTPTAMGKRNLSMVAGGLALARLVGASDQPTPEIMSILLPEPGATMQIGAGVLSLLGIAAWRSRRVR